MNWLRTFLAVPDTSDPNERQRLNSFLRGILLFSVFITALATLFLLIAGSGRAQIMIINGVLSVCLLVMLYLQHRGWLRRVSLMFVILLWGYITFDLIGFGGIRNPISTAYLLLILVGGTLLGQAGAVLTLILSILATLVIVYIEVSGHLPPAIADLTLFQHWISFMTALLGTGVVMVLWQRSINRAISQARIELTERARAESALRQSESKLRSLLAALPDIIIIFDAKGYILEVFTGRSEQMAAMNAEMAGKSIYEMMPEFATRGIQNVLDLAIISGGVEEFQYSMGNSWFEAHAVAFQLDGETRVLWLARNITRQKNAEEEIRLLNSELEERVRRRTAELEAVVQQMEEFTYTVSHDLRTPLRGINGFAGILANDYQNHLPPEGQDYLLRIQRNSLNMGKLIDDLLEFSRLGRKSITQHQIDLAGLCREILRDFEQEISSRSVKITLPELPYARADYDLMKSVMTNLLSNALKFTRRQNNPEIEIGSLRKDGKTVYYVRDNGVGFDMSYANKIFGVFQRLHEDSDFEGTGVGLAIVQRIISKHGGKVWAESQVHEGTTFYFTLE
jgi:PAS domain S-box-containing protein